MQSLMSGSPKAATMHGAIGVGAIAWRRECPRNLSKVVQALEDLCMIPYIEDWQHFLPKRNHAIAWSHEYQN